MILNLYWLGWKYIVYKLLAYRYLNKLNVLGRYCDTRLEVVKSGSHIITQVQGCGISHM